eukprot:GHVT01077408.1.p1 GENE.GHVT01077408.1~~GHVT01077408.1.p1  ORF type:complete len:110 (-),score=21.79 GHVT01077408.1:301-630(-)
MSTIQEILGVTPETLRPVLQSGEPLRKDASRAKHPSGLPRETFRLCAGGLPSLPTSVQLPQNVGGALLREMNPNQTLRGEALGGERACAPAALIGPRFNKQHTDTRHSA